LKTLITAADIRDFSTTGQKTLCVDADAIITPSARDEARELSISIRVGTEKSAETASKGTTAAGAVHPDFLARVVAEVISCLQQTQQVKAPQADTDPSGMRLIRGDRLVFSGAVTGSRQDKLQVAELVGAEDSKQLAVCCMRLDDTSIQHETASDETVHIVEGNLHCTINGKHYYGSAGDSFFIPAKQQTALSTTGRATCLVVASAVR